MCEKVAADIEDDALTDMRHQSGAYGRKHNAQADNADKEDRHPSDHHGILIGHRFVEHPLRDFRNIERGNTRQCAEHQGQDHLVAVSGYVFSGSLEMFPLKRCFQAFIHVKLITRHASPPPLPEDRTAAHRSASSTRVF